MAPQQISIINVDTYDPLFDIITLAIVAANEAGISAAVTILRFMEYDFIP